LDKWLSDKAKAAAANQIKSTSWCYNHVVATRGGARVGWSETDYVRCKSPCQFVTKTFYNDGLPSGAVPEKLAKEWAKMLNEMAEKGWEASLVSAASCQLVTPAKAITDLGPLQPPAGG